MQYTIFAFLTDEQARTTKAVEANLDRSLKAGAWWFSQISFDQLR